MSLPRYRGIIAHACDVHCACMVCLRASQTVTVIMHVVASGNSSFCSVYLWCVRTACTIHSSCTVPRRSYDNNNLSETMIRMCISFGRYIRCWCWREVSASASQQNIARAWYHPYHRIDPGFLLMPRFWRVRGRACYTENHVSYQTGVSYSKFTSVWNIENDVELTNLLHSVMLE